MYGTTTISGIEKQSSSFRSMRKKWNEYQSHPTSRSKGGKNIQKGNEIKIWNGRHTIIHITVTTLTTVNKLYFLFER